ncbi:hypothetical protein FHS57_001022 [Runella defluvii]|uniref:Signal transduction histidine kinase internal region domain-containing protein n=1 Tax=Runella defluvii TaxID=370973 RepID=A0A7W6EP28_9BACT|nr:histidine kinase [Runella defluvii]MBB3837028.1 hypothetical protein [Runella defluvii]
MNRLDQPNLQLFDVVEQALDFYNSRLWLRILAHLCYIYLSYTFLANEFFVEDLKYGVHFYVYWLTNLAAAYAIFYYLFPTYFVTERYSYFFLPVAFWYFTVFSYFTHAFLQEVYSNNTVVSYSASREDNPFLAFLDVYSRYGLWGHFRSISFAFVVFFEFKSHFGLIIFVKSVKYFIENIIKQKHLNDLNHDLESRFLQSQLNPHFLFNSLNNIYGLILNQKPTTTAAISQLQSLLKESFDDSKGNNVPLLSEINYLKNYISLEKIRHDQNVHIDFKVDENTVNKHFIAPRVLLPFVENAFKHGLSDNLKYAQIDIHISLKNNQLHFYIYNSKPDLKVSKTKVGGIGLVNIKRRLSLLYPDHSLQIHDNPNSYEVHLRLPL